MKQKIKNCQIVFINIKVFILQMRYLTKLKDKIQIRRKNLQNKYQLRVLHPKEHLQFDKANNSKETIVQTRRLE